MSSLLWREHHGKHGTLLLTGAEISSPYHILCSRWTHQGEMDVHYDLCENHCRICAPSSSIWAELSLTVAPFLPELLPRQCSSTFQLSPFQSASQRQQVSACLQFQVINYTVILNHHESERSVHNVVLTRWLNKSYLHRCNMIKCPRNVLT